MKNTYYTWDDFVANFGKKMVSAEDLYNSMKNIGLTDFELAEFDYHFLSDSKEKLEKLNDFLLQHYPYKFEEYKRWEGDFELRGKTNAIPITKDNLLCWVLDMTKRGYEFDCRFDAFGALTDNKNPKLPNFDKTKEDFYFDKAVECYNSGNLSGAIFNWSIVLRINPKDPNSYYSQAIVKNELYIWKSALRDYDKAIEIAPNFVDAIINRGTVKDENGDYEGAIIDYNKVIELQPDNAMVYFNRGNSKLNKGDKKGACEDWKKAKELGADYTDDRINENCK